MDEKYCICWKCLHVHKVSERVPIKEQPLRSVCPQKRCGGKTLMGMPFSISS